jgi:hypothetical protein
MKKTIIIFSVLAGLAITAQAQFSQFHVGLAFPSGKFAEDITLSSSSSQSNTVDIAANAFNAFERGNGFAATGFTVGYKYYSPLSVQNLSWVFGIEAFYNGLNSDLKDNIEDAFNKLDVDIDITYPAYINFPVTIGLNYAVPLSGEKIKLYGEAALGINYSIMTNGSANYEYNKNIYDYEGKFKFTSEFGVAYGLEGGLFINEKYSIGLRYNNLGSYKYKYETEEEYDIKTYNGIEHIIKDPVKRKCSKALPIVNISLCFGILF